MCNSLLCKSKLNVAFLFRDCSIYKDLISGVRNNGHQTEQNCFYLKTLKKRNRVKLRGGAKVVVKQENLTVMLQNHCIIKQLARISKED